MKKRDTIITMLIGIAPLLFAETNALIEIKLFKDWIIEGERIVCNLAIKNTGTSPILLFEDAVDFDIGQFAMRRLTKFGCTGGDRTVGSYPLLAWDQPIFKLPPGETHVYEGRRFLLDAPLPSEKFIVSVYLGNGFWLDSEPITVKGVVPNSIEYVATLTDVNGSRDLVAVTYKNERWLYTKLDRLYFPAFPLSFTNKIRVEPHDGTRLYKIWDGDKPMIYRKGTSLILDGPDENNVFGKWTRERKQRAEADNVEVRRKKAEQP